MRFYAEQRETLGVTLQPRTSAQPLGRVVFKSNYHKVTETKSIPCDVLRVGPSPPVSRFRRFSSAVRAARSCGCRRTAAARDCAPRGCAPRDVPSIRLLLLMKRGVRPSDCALPSARQRQATEWMVLAGESRGGGLRLKRTACRQRHVFSYYYY